jgi:hypothetical protein
MEETAAMGVGAGLVQGLIGYVITIVVAMATAGMIALVVKSLGAMQKVPARAAPAPTPAMPITPQAEEAEIARRVAVVAAAVAAVAGETRILHIGEEPVPGLWRTTGRALHHGSHTPHR